MAIIQDYEGLRMIDGKFQTVRIVDTPSSGRARRRTVAAADTYPFFQMAHREVSALLESHGFRRGPIASLVDGSGMARNAKKILRASEVGMVEDQDLFIFFYPDEDALVEMKLRYS